MPYTTLGEQVAQPGYETSVVISAETPVLHYYIMPDAVTEAGGNTDIENAAFVAGYTGYLVMILEGPYRTYCMTVQSSDTSHIIVYGEHAAKLTNGGSFRYITVIHTAKSMYSYCVTNNKDVIGLSCDYFEIMDQAQAEPESMASNITFYYTIGQYKQAVILSKCTIWDNIKYNRLRKFNQLRDLVYHWHNISNMGNIVYLIITVSSTVSGITYYQNVNFSHVYASGGNTITARGYLSGVPANVQSKYSNCPEFTVAFSEAWND